ncbi:hypothetical protein FACS1894111_05910 [Clostridia bacterium]|nr:hypothetical protein FACS1894111_05910 [Clostridia bacterium]
MTKQEYDKRNLQKKCDLVTESLEKPPRSRREKDIFNLKYMLYGIGHESICFRSGCVSSLKRAIARLEESN